VFYSFFRIVQFNLIPDVKPIPVFAADALLIQTFPPIWEKQGKQEPEYSQLETE
jgi:hypothetical protein